VQTRATRRPVPAAAIELAKKFEGFRKHAYLCPAGVWTVGYGHTKGVQKGDWMEESYASRVLGEDLKDAASAVQRLISSPLNENQFAALVDFVFNLGAGALEGSTLRELLNAGRYDAVPEQLRRWVKATDPKTGKKVVLNGLVARREAEIALWNTPDD
jgi:lysozyme